MKKDTKDVLVAVGVVGAALAGIAWLGGRAESTAREESSRRAAAARGADVPPPSYPRNPGFLHPKVGSILTAYADVGGAAMPFQVGKAKIAKLLDDRWYRVEPVGEATIDAGAVKQVLRVTDVGVDAGLRAGYANREPGAGAWFFGG